MTTYFTADLHLGHDKIVRELRGDSYEDAADMDEKIIDNIHTIVLPGDELWILGDFAWREHAKYREQLFIKTVNLIRGNHDPSLGRCSEIFGEAHDVLIGRRFGGKRFTLCHWPWESWPGRIHLHGHRHHEDEYFGTEPKTGRVNVCWDLWYRPLPLDEVLELAQCSND